MLNPAKLAERSPPTPLRVPLLLGAAVLALLSLWLLVTELMRPGIEQLPTDPANAIAAAQRRGAAWRAASVGAVRSDLWAESAYTYADLLWPETHGKANSNSAAGLDRARISLDRAIGHGPHQSAAWLLLAGLGQQFRWSGFSPLDVLKMAYYTGPSERRLIPLRLRIAVRGDKFDDFEIRQFVSRDLRFLLAQKQMSLIVDAYAAASTAGKKFIEQSLKDIDPAALKSLQTAATGRPMPD
jgi:hypothetical protein